ncbi:MAG TPA: neutral/alkaline non-lysosomal ceramidase N-terminal domain-containing protein [Acidimicrobiales bacterium]
MEKISVGTAVGDLTPELGVAMGGYGARVGTANGVAAPLCCRTVVFDDGVAPVALVVCDLLFVTLDISRRVREGVAATLGWDPSRTMVVGTHTHSGPAALTDSLNEAYVIDVARRIVDSIVEAYTNRKPARLTVTSASVASISQNRRDPDGPIDETARVLFAQDEETGEVISSVVNYSCHATILEADNLAISPDFPGAMVEAVQQAVGGRAIYLQGCAGSINPVWTTHTVSEVRRIGNILGSAVVRAIEEAKPAGRGQWSVNLSRGEDVVKEVHGGDVISADPLGAAQVAAILQLKERSALSETQKELDDVNLAIAEGRSDDKGRTKYELTARRAALQMESVYVRRAYSYDTRLSVSEVTLSGDESVEVQALRLGNDVVIVGLPGEPFLGMADAIREQCGVRHVLVAGYANEAIGYVPIESEFPFDGYEVGCARFSPEAADQLVAAAVLAVSASDTECGGRLGA